MTSKVQIARLALQHIGDRFDINSLEEASTEAEQVNLVFDDVRRELLRQHPWKFAKKYVKPAQLAGTPPALWAYQFSYPPDAVRVWEIVNPLGRDRPPIRFDSSLIDVAGNDVRVLLADVAEPEFMYTKDETVVSRFDPSFSMALSYLIAARIAMPITGDPGIRSEMQDEALREIAQASSNDANEGVEESKMQDPDWIRVRNGGGSDTNSIR